ncbi:hypothetical protein C8R43DRAFT_943410 [Mycena crocata]|nr:hypothetical protein C8R43DRAFT_943410 [Mycena crocata]
MGDGTRYCNIPRLGLAELGGRMEWESSEDSGALGCGSEAVRMQSVTPAPIIVGQNAGCSSFPVALYASSARNTTITARRRNLPRWTCARLADALPVRSIQCMLRDSSFIYEINQINARVRQLSMHPVAVRYPPEFHSHPVAPGPMLARAPDQAKRTRTYFSASDSDFSASASASVTVTVTTRFWNGNDSILPSIQPGRSTRPRSVRHPRFNLLACLHAQRSSTTTLLAQYIYFSTPRSNSMQINSMRINSMHTNFHPVESRRSFHAREINSTTSDSDSDSAHLQYSIGLGISMQARNTYASEEHLCKRRKSIYASEEHLCKRRASIQESRMLFKYPDVVQIFRCCSNIQMLFKYSKLLFIPRIYFAAALEEYECEWEEFEHEWVLEEYEHEWEEFEHGWEEFECV